ncbi:hypothetical protein K1T44_0465 [Listeria innocua]|nr:hypothetical protein [Listeria innocua]UNB89592.1 hypothetical protein K1T44_0465 [Listeria innocua]
MRRKVSLVIAGQKTESCFQQKQTSNLIASGGSVAIHGADKY